jgi:hypothetical protein
VRPYLKITRAKRLEAWLKCCLASTKFCDQTQYCPPKSIFKPAYRMLRHEDLELQTSLGYIVRKTKKGLLVFSAQ